jgi:hypothetical protein
MSFREWHCDCSLLDASRRQHAGIGSVVLTEFGEVTLSVRLPGNLTIGSFPLEQDITGTEETGLAVCAKRAMVQRARFNTGTAETRVVFVAQEIRIARQPVGTIAQQRIYLKGLHLVGPCAFTDGTTHYTIDSLSNDSNDSRQGRISAVLQTDTEHSCRDVQVLLGLAQRCRARAPFRECDDATGVCSITLIHEDTAVSAGHPLIPPRGRDVAAFMNTALQQYPQLESALELPRLIDYYCLSVEASFGELKFILAGVFMEGLKFYWAKNVAGYSTDKKASGLIRGFEKAKTSGGRSVHYTFEELIVAAYAHYGLHPTFTFIEDRNALFHTGAPGAAQLGAAPLWPVIRPELEKLYQQIDHFLLTILGYSGSVRRWEAADNDVPFP